MAQDLSATFSNTPFAAFFLAPGQELWMNEAAMAAEPPLCDRAAMTRMLRVAMQEKQCQAEEGAFTLLLLTDALHMRNLTLMPMDDGVLAVAVEESAAPVNVFSGLMRESLTNIFAVLPMLASRLDDTDVRLAEQIQNNCYSLLRMAVNMESASRVERKLYNMAPVDMGALVSALCESAASVCREQNVPIEWKVPQQVVPVRADARMLSTAILNLLRNSLQYTRDGNRISVKLEIVRHHALLTVQDRGLGIRPEHVGQVFDPYFSADPYGDSYLHPGVGLGLSVVRETICGFGGAVNAESTFGEGTSVYLSVPLDKEPAEVLGSDSADYLLNKYSAVYVQLCGYCRLPALP